VLAAASTGVRPIWSSGSSTRMASFPLLPGVESLGVLADHDAAGAGERAAREVEARWRAAGTEVRIFMWEKLGDINDAIRQGAAMGSSPEETLAHLGMREISRHPSELSQASEQTDGFLTHSPRASSSCFAQKIEEIADERRPAEVPVPRGERAKLSDIRNHSPRSTTPHRRPLIFADPSTLAAALCGRLVGPNQWLGLCPCHKDREASLSIPCGRNGSTVIKCHARCKQGDVLGEVRRLGFRLDREPPPELRRARRPPSVSTSVALAACNLSEHRMFELLRSEDAKNADDALLVTYNQFCEAGIRRSSISPGLRAMDALGLITVERAPFNIRKHRYELNQYRLAHGWQLFEPKPTSPQARKAMLAKAREAAKSARKSEG
jgi:hypothetical protein